LSFFKLVSHATEESYLKDARLHDVLLDFVIENSFPKYFSFIDQNLDLCRKVHRYLHLTLACMEHKLGYLQDDKVPHPLVFSEADFIRVRNSELGKVILDKLSKVKGKKVRKSLIAISYILLENLPSKEIEVQ
jgi:hypothetical protein